MAFSVSQSTNLGLTEIWVGWIAMKFGMGIICAQMKGPNASDNPPYLSFKFHFLIFFCNKHANSLNLQN